MKVQEQISTGAFWVFERVLAPPTDYCERLSWGYCSFLVNSWDFWKATSERFEMDLTYLPLGSLPCNKWYSHFRSESAWWKDGEPVCRCRIRPWDRPRPLYLPWESMFGFHVRPEYPRETWFLAFSFYPKQVVRPHSSSERNQVFGRRYLCGCKVGLQPVWFLRIQRGLPPYYWKDSWFWRLWRW